MTTQITHDWRWFEADPKTVYFWELDAGLPENHTVFLGPHAVERARLAAAAPKLRYGWVMALAWIEGLCAGWGKSFEDVFEAGHPVREARDAIKEAQP